MPNRSAFFFTLAILALLPHLATAQGTCALFAAQGGNPGAAGNTSETNLLLVNPLSGAINAVIGSLGMPITGLARHPITGELFGATAGGSALRNLVRVGPTTGAATVIGPFGTIPQTPRIADISFRADGTLFGWNESSDDLVTINLATGASTVVGNAGIDTLGSGLAFSPTGTLFFAPNWAGTNSLRTVDMATGLTTVLAGLTNAPLPTYPISALTFNAAGTLFGVNLRNALPRDSFLVTIDTASGAVTTREGEIIAPRIDALEYTCLPAFDFDGDFKADIGVFQSTSAEWFIAGNGFGGIRRPGVRPTQVQFGAPGDIPLPADYDGDGLTDLALFRPATGEWFILGSNSGFSTFLFGAGAATGLGDTPVPADYDGDGRVDPAIYRASDGIWFILGTTSGFTTLAWGAGSASGLGDTPVPADYDGDGKANPAVYRRSTGTWFVFGSITSQFLDFGAPSWSGLGDTPVPSDYDGDGKADIAIYRLSSGTWYIMGSRSGFQRIVFGSAANTGLGDVPVPADYDGDGKTDVAVYRASSGNWHFLGTRIGFQTQAWGAATASGLGDLPLNRPAAVR